MFLLQWRSAKAVTFHGSNLSDLRFRMAIWLVHGESSNNTAKSLDPELTIFIFSPEGPCESYVTQVKECKEIITTWYCSGICETLC